MIIYFEAAVCFIVIPPAAAHMSTLNTLNTSHDDALSPIILTPNICLHTNILVLFMQSFSDL